VVHKKATKKAAETEKQEVNERLQNYGDVMLWSCSAAELFGDQ